MVLSPGHKAVLPVIVTTTPLPAVTSTVASPVPHTSVPVTVYVPGVRTVMEAEPSPLDQLYVSAPLAVSCTSSPGQIAKGPLAEIVIVGPDPEGTFTLPQIGSAQSVCAQSVSVTVPTSPGPAV